MPRCEGLDAVEDEERLELQWLFGPERAVVIERWDPIGGWHEVRGAFAGDFADGFDDGLFGFAVVPGKKRAASAGNGCGLAIRVSAKVGQVTDWTLP
jgi:hypothetical protein